VTTTRIMVALVLWAAGNGGLPEAVRAQTLDVEFIGNASIRISDGQRTVVTDYPYESGYSRYMDYDFARTRPVGPVIVLITHRHRDHFDPGLFAGTGWTFIGPEEGDRVPERVAAEPDIIQFGDITVESFATPHAGIPHRSYRLRWHGHSFFFVGDTEDVRTLDAARDVDVLFITPWLLRQAEQNGVQLTAGRVIVYHHQTGEDVRCTACEVPVQGATFRLGA
jgi:hypothetical protein